MWQRLILILALLHISVCTEESINSIQYADGFPKLNIGDSETGYHGLVKENETLVEVTPPIRATGAEICSFKIVNKHHGDVPFEIISLKNGEAELRARRNLNCEKRRNYKFDIVAVSCGGRLSENSTVHITVVDINEYAPAFTQSAYLSTVDEGRLYEEIVRVEATDKDCTPKFGDICKYEILTNDQPFSIDSEGSIRNTEPLEYDRSHNYILSVVAYDCGMKQSLPVMVTIKVNRVCKIGWKGIPERIDYAPVSGRELLFPNAHLKLCDAPCNLKSIVTRVNLSTKHIGKGCDRDTYSVQSQRKLCGASSESVDLLPSPEAATDLKWSKNLSMDEGHESDQLFEFDGVSSALSVSPTYLDHALAPVFTISTWMKHNTYPNQDKHAKEHILCSADDHKMSRHHYALFVRNCRLILLLRRDFTKNELNIFRPAEWRWKIPQVCDNEWHHYAISVEFPNVQLYIDGSLFKSEKKNPEVIDDWPLHPTSDINTTLTVGACWQGSENRMKHHFHGYLAGLSILLNKTESPEVLICLHKCKESMETPGIDFLEPGMELLSNTELTMISAQGDNKTNLETLIKHISYVNYREYPTPGRRNIHLTTNVLCENGYQMKIPAVESYVMVLQPQTPNIIINGSNNIAREYQDFRGGVRIFPELKITIDHDEKQSHLDSCIISVYPALNPDHEIVSLPEEKLREYGILAKISKDGATLTGTELAYNYQQLLKDVEYSNQKPAYYLNRVFKLICSEMNGRFLSNEYIQTLTVIHPRVPNTSAPSSSSANPADEGLGHLTHHIPPPPMHNLRDVHHVEAKDVHPYLSPYMDGTFDQAQAFTGGGKAVAIIIGVCCGFLLLMVALGWVRIRAAHQPVATEEIQDAEMAWDDSALNITVNPMEQLEINAVKQLNGGKPDAANEAEDDSSDDNMSYDYDSSEDDDDNAGTDAPNKVRDLEWDNSTLAM